MTDEFDSRDEFGRFERRDLCVRRLPSPGIAAVLAVLLPGLGHVYVGRLFAGAAWFLLVSFGYWAILVPGMLLHAISIWTAYRAAEREDGPRSR
jgi:hypothetical protein